MIKFITLILSLHVGIVPVELAVTDPVARVELHLDGQKVGESSAAPWTFAVDLGRDLRPHRLDAIAFDGQGKELERISQWINYARQSREASLVLEPSGADRPRRGRIVWAATDGRDPIDIHLSFDGQPLAVDLQGQFALPSYELSTPHHLQAKVIFGDQQEIEAEAVFGGIRGETLISALTAVPILIDPDVESSGQQQLGPRDRDHQDLSQWLEVDGESVHAVMSASTESRSLAPAEDEGHAIMVVRDTHIDRDLRQILRKKRQRLLSKTGSFLGPEDQVEFLLTYNLVQDPRGVHRPYPVTRDFNRFGLWNLFYQDFPQIRQPKKQSIWWSLALAGKRVADLKQPRVVVLLLSKKPQSRPALSFEQAQIYLRSLRVPLLVWAPEEETFQRLGMAPERPYLGADGMLALLADVDDLLRRQEIVWVEGDYLPTEITLSEQAPEGIRLAY